MKLLNRIMRIRRPVVFRFEEGLYGSVYAETRTPIYINLTNHNRRDPVKTYIHECVHILFPKMSEASVKSLERHVWFKLTAREKFLLARKLYSRKWRSR